MGAKRGNQLVVGHPRVVLPRRAAVFRQICIAEFLIQFRNGVLPLFFGAFSTVLLHIFGKFFIEQTVEIYQFHFLSPPLFAVELFRDRRYALSGFLSAFFRPRAACRQGRDDEARSVRDNRARRRLKCFPYPIFPRRKRTDVVDVAAGFAEIAAQINRRGKRVFRTCLFQFIRLLQSAVDGFGRRGRYGADTDRR